MIKLVAAYLRARLPEHFIGWTQEALEDYVMFHMEQGTLKCAISNGAITAVVIGWQTSTRELRPWTWQCQERTGGYWYWDQLAGDDAISVMACCAKMFAHNPAAALLPAYGVRHGKLRDIDLGLKLYRQGNRLYGRQRTSTSSS